MNIVVAGGSGFLGEPLVRRLLARGDEVAVLTRNPARVAVGRPLEWDPSRPGSWSEEVAQADTVINLAGENIGDGRWTEARKERLLRSRLTATTALVEAMKTRPERRRLLVNASAVGFYGLRGDEELDETSAGGSGFLATLTRRWEETARAAEPVARVVILRFGVMLAADGGALAKMLPPFRFGVGGRVGSGEQWMSWIDREDAARAVEWAVGRDTARGVFNVTAPQPVRNKEFTSTLGTVLRRPTIFPVPGLILRLALGEMADEALLGGQRVLPARASAEGFNFLYPTLESSLRHLLR